MKASPDELGTAAGCEAAGRQTFAEIAPRLARTGWPAVIPLAGKRPIIEGWQRFNVDPVGHDLLQEWCRRWPTANVGLPLGHGVVAIDIDITTPELAMRATAVADDILGWSPLIRIGKAPKQVRLYRGDDIKTAKHHPLEVFGSTGQVVLYGLHPDTRREYLWPLDEPLRCSPVQLPAVDAARVTAFVAAVRRILPPPLTRGAAIQRQTNSKGDRRIARWTTSRPSTLAARLRGAIEGHLHDVLIRVAASLVVQGFSDAAIRQFIDEHFAAPRSGPYSAVWQQVDEAIASARRKFGAVVTAVRLVPR